MKKIKVKWDNVLKLLIGSVLAGYCAGIWVAMLFEVYPNLLHTVLGFSALVILSFIDYDFEDQLKDIEKRKRLSKGHAHVN